MILELKLRCHDGVWMLTSDDLPGLNVCGLNPESVMADFVPLWEKMHEHAPKQVMRVPKRAETYAATLARAKKRKAKRP